MDLLAREDAPLTEQEWGRIDEAVSKAAHANLVGRRFLSLHGPLGLGSQVTWVDALEGVSPGAVGAPGEDDPVAPGRRRLLTLDLVSKDFTLMWRDVLNAQGQQLPLDVAAALLLPPRWRAEDNLILRHRRQPRPQREGTRPCPLPLDWTNREAGWRRSRRRASAGLRGRGPYVARPPSLHRCFAYRAVAEG